MSHLNLTRKNPNEKKKPSEGKIVHISYILNKITSLYGNIT